MPISTMMIPTTTSISTSVKARRRGTVSVAKFFMAGRAGARRWDVLATTTGRGSGVELVVLRAKETINPRADQDELVLAPCGPRRRRSPARGDGDLLVLKEFDVVDLLPRP